MTLHSCTMKDLSKNQFISIANDDGNVYRNVCLQTLLQRELHVLKYGKMTLNHYTL